MNTEITLIEQFFGERLSPDLIQLVADADYRRLHAFQQAERQFERSYRLPERASGQYRPYISGDALTYEELSHGLTVGETTRFYESHDPTDLFKAADSLNSICFSVICGSQQPPRIHLRSVLREISRYICRCIGHLPGSTTYLSQLRKTTCGGTHHFSSPKTALSPITKYFGGYPPRVLSDADRGRIVQRADFTSMNRYLPAELAQSELQREVHIMAAEK